MDPGKSSWMNNLSRKSRSSSMKNLRALLSKQVSKLIRLKGLYRKKGSWHPKFKEENLQDQKNHFLKRKSRKIMFKRISSK